MNPVATVELIVRYAETDQMGLAYHANYLVWCDMARTEYLRERAMSYREMEERGLLLAVTGVQIRYRAPLRYDDRVRVRCWVRDVATRRVEFGYAIDRQADARLAATARTALTALDSHHGLRIIPDHVRSVLSPIADPVRL